ncbi:hypothetical protein BDN72DRAFT_835388 [Pluteus cervinus]|uniref:Uncharacterized protein n=1 Tax=Pluteus cervinus TaxID=181527 RepID=A0ACD3B7U3_9AGAR|nr:hypothetical protein BDN72DRAFT_835388 [Pluteus cervinus]
MFEPYHRSRPTFLMNRRIIAEPNTVIIESCALIVGGMTRIGELFKQQRLHTIPTSVGKAVRSLLIPSNILDRE